MARAKKASRRRYRRFGYSRRSRWRRYRRRYPKRSGRRFPKGTEVKSVSKLVNYSQQIGVVSGANLITYKPGFCTMIGGSNNNAAYNISIVKGTESYQRVGTKIEPIKLRISGSLTLTTSNDGQVNSAPNFWQVRCIVYQVKGGNSSFEPSNGNYHQMALTTADGTLGGSTLLNVLMSYYFQANDIQFSAENWLANNVLAKIPLRRGIGGICKILYKKSFWVNSQKNPVKQFRFITRKPARLVWPEANNNVGDSNNNAAVVNNAIYILWMFQPGAFRAAISPDINLTYSVDLFYTDK